MAEKQERYTQRDFSELSRKLKTLGKDLTPKENAFLSDVMDNAGRSIQGKEVQGFGAQYDDKAYTPQPTGGPDSMTDSAAAIRIAIKGTFVSK
jgi:hypothetical protein